jgi:hypothetical protein
MFWRKATESEDGSEITKYGKIRVHRSKATVRKRRSAKRKLWYSRAKKAALLAGIGALGYGAYKQANNLPSHTQSHEPVCDEQCILNNKILTVLQLHYPGVDTVSLMQLFAVYNQKAQMYRISTPNASDEAILREIFRNEPF